ncbi:MAG: YCF48-related protein [Calditrichota bacterium]
MKYFILLLSAAVLLQVSSAFGLDWTWQNPLPTGCNLNGVAFAGEQECWAVGNLGTVLHSTDGGQNWQLIPLDVNVDLWDITFVDALHGWIIGAGNTILRTTDGGTTWSELDVGTTCTVASIYFVNADEGWAVGNGGYTSIIRHTTDGGLTWAAQTPPATCHDRLYDVFFLNASTGWAVGNYGSRIHTSDGGQTWVNQTSGWQFRELRSVFFLDDSLGWAVGNTKILRTTNGGVLWNSGFPDLNNYVYHTVRFSDPANGIAITGNCISRTTNGGFTWHSDCSIGGADYGRSPSGSSVLVNGLGMIAVSQTGDSAWQGIRHGPVVNMTAVHFADPLVGWAAGYAGTVLRTMNSGRTWTTCTPIEAGYAGQINKIWAMDSLRAIVVGYYGVFVRTTDGGQTWIEPLENPPVFPEDLAMEDPLHGWVVAAQGTILYTTDGGESWERQTSGTQNYLNGVASAGNGKAYAVGVGGILITTDGGHQWTPFPISGTLLNAVAAVGPNLAWAVDNEGRVLRTTDGGVSWDVIYLGSFFAGSRRVRFTDELHGWIVTGGNRIYISDNGGITWNAISGPFGVSVNDIQPFTPDIGIVVGDGGAIVRFGGEINPIRDRGTVSLPQQLSLTAFPNPFNPSTTLSFDLPRADHARLAVYDITGRLTAVLADDDFTAGTHRIRFDGTTLASGIYFARLETAGKQQIHKLVLMK